MGLYVEPNGDKKKWCERFVEIKVGGNTHFNEFPKDCLPVCCVDNIAFYAVAVGYDKQEFDYFRDTPDDRDKSWHLVPKTILKENCPNWEMYVKE